MGARPRRGPPDNLYILQSRPVTAIAKPTPEARTDLGDLGRHGDVRRQRE